MKQMQLHEGSPKASEGHILNAFLITYRDFSCTYRSFIVHISRHCSHILIHPTDHDHAIAASISAKLLPELSSFCFSTLLLALLKPHRLNVSL